MTLVAEHSLHTLCCESAIFISDLQLSDETPRLLEKFQEFCEVIDPSSTQYLIILGDLFEAYCGDDDRSSIIVAVETVFLALHSRGVRVAFMPGNRDFMVGQAFIQRCYLKLLVSPCVLKQRQHNNIYNNILLAHGDEWCTLDTEYQHFRSTSRQAKWQMSFLAQPLYIRQAQVKAYRTNAKAHISCEKNSKQAAQSVDIMDVEDSTVLAAAVVYHCHTVLHGHTHKPSVRQLNDKYNWSVSKYVLGDWDEHNQYPTIYAVLSVKANLQLCVFL
jgi:UDP-2,3-diacylglucosamine hydrolase